LGDLIEIEERSSCEVINDEILKGYTHVSVKNPAFDVTPREYIDLICTEVGAIPPEMAYIIIKEHLGYSLDDIYSTGKSKAYNQKC
jgi:ribose 1,5-bisphosphate isomerase